MDSVLIVSSSEKGLVLLKELLAPNSYQEIAAAKSCGEAKRLLLKRDFDLCIVNTPLTDEFGANFAVNITTGGITQVLLIVKSEICDEVAAKVEDVGVFTVAKPLNRQVFWTALKFIAASHKKLTGLKNDNTALHKKIEDMRFVNQAKCILIEQLKMTESEAHNYIKDQAMNKRITKKEIAANILKTYAN